MIGPTGRDILDRYREPEILALIEQELDPVEREALLAQLGDDPDVLALVRRLEDDRRALRTIADPALPRDFLSALEPRLARPMLMDPAGGAPGSYRRRHRTPRSRWAIARYAVAAVIGLAVLAALWAGVTGVLVPTPAGPSGPVVTGNGDETPPAPLRERVPATASDETDGAIVHHARPLPVGERNEAIVEATPAPAPRDVLVPFALVVDTSSAAKAEVALRSVLDARSSNDDKTPVVLVRNFSFEEASRLARTIRIDPDEAPTAVTGVGEGPAAGTQGFDRHRWERLAKSLRRIRRGGDRSDADTRTGRVLLGDEAAGPSYEEQLELSSHGATHTVTIAASEVIDVLHRLTVEAGQPCTVRALITDGEIDPPQPNRGADVAPTVLQRWITDLGAVQEMLDDLRARDAAELVHLPVVIEDR